MELLGKRYRILQVIHSNQPIGRRSLSQSVGITERVLRSELEFLKVQGLLTFSSAGMRVTQEGVQLLEEMEEIMREILGLHELELQLEKKLQLKKVIVVQGDSYQSPSVIHDLGKAAVEQIKVLVEPGWTIAVAEGATMATVAEMMKPSPKLKELLFVPARGGLGEQLEIQANTICSKMAHQSNGSYRLLHIPDHLSKEAYQSLLHDPQIEEVIKTIRSARMIIHGIGEAKNMAERRKAGASFIQMLEKEKAVSEAFGYFFNQEGEIIHKVQTVGLRLEDLRKADHILAVAGGSNKAMPILSFLKSGVHDVLITDEGAARDILAKLK